MIENIILKVLKADAKLAELIDGRIYPEAAQVSVLPAVVIDAGAPVSPVSEPWCCSQNVTFTIYAGDAETARAVCARFYGILQKYDNFFYADLKDSGIIIREAHAVNPSASTRSTLETEQEKAKVISFNFTYTKCAV